MNAKKQGTARGSTEKEEGTAQFYSRNEMLTSRPNWDYSGALDTKMGSPGESKIAGGATWEKLSPFTRLLHPQPVQCLPRSVSLPETGCCQRSKGLGSATGFTDGRSELKGTGGGFLGTLTVKSFEL